MLGKHWARIGPGQINVEILEWRIARHHVAVDVRGTEKVTDRSDRLVITPRLGFVITASLHGQTGLQAERRRYCQLSFQRAAINLGSGSVVTLHDVAVSIVGLVTRRPEGVCIFQDSVESFRHKVDGNIVECMIPVR